MNESTKPLTIQILQEVETFLDKHDITIPDPNRTGDSEEARLFGDAYIELETAIDRLIERRNQSLEKKRKELIRQREELPETMASMMADLDGQIDLINELIKEM